ncbi:DNA repair protein RecO [Gammaproteobacteria bacterium ESL0073]|nr:DNA repair protein RecO [Gammaproteobacteria bacterium ESL0073]
MNNFDLQAFVLHSKPYREQSALVDFFTAEGRFRAVLRKARTSAGSIARPFMPLSISLVGKGELKTVKSIEATHHPLLLQGKNLFSGFYLNELLIKLLPLEDACPQLFIYYQKTLQQLSSETFIEPLLRGFEWQLLHELGGVFSLVETADGEPVQTDGFYIYNPENGLQKIMQLQSGAFYGRDLLAMNELSWASASVLTSAKRLMRQVLAVHLQGKPLMSRQLFNNLSIE